MNNQKLIEESPAPCLSENAREKLRQTALEIARLFDYVGVGSVEFLVDNDGDFYFTEIKARIQIEHAVSEMLSNVDIVAEQIRIAAGAPMSIRQEKIQLRGWTMQCRINAEDPWNHYLPSPGQLQRFRLPAGPFVRVDTYGYAGCRIPVRYDSLLANVIVWGNTRAECVQRMKRALEDFRITGVQTNLTLHRHILQHPGVTAGKYDVSTMQEVEIWHDVLDEEERRDLAIAAAVAFALRNQGGDVVMPNRVRSGWHTSSRRLPS
ncbi:MAG: hypothetical protein HC802_15905 [Caldilineaceae bacterium]|nr:hypothetical protein [Caldilineaceae bacterium]